MTDFFQRHRAGVLMLAFAALSLFFMTLQMTPTINAVKSIVWFMVSPEIVYSGRFFNKLDDIQGRLFELTRAEGENHILRRQNAHLSKREIERDILEIENNRLRTLLDLREQMYPQAIAAEVIGRDTRDWFNSILINKGTKEGIPSIGSVVAIVEGRPVLVGRVSEVQAGSSRVLLLTDALSFISVAIKRTGEIGLLEGRGKPWGMIQYLLQKSEVATGDEVVTAGLGGLFAPGIPIGTVVNVSDTSDGFFKMVRMVPYANFGSVREVLVIHRKEIGWAAPSNE